MEGDMSFNITNFKSSKKPLQLHSIRMQVFYKGYECKHTNKTSVYVFSVLM